MELADRNKLNGDSQHNAFTLLDPNTGKLRSIKDMTDQEIDRHIKGMQLELTSQMQQRVQAYKTIFEMNTGIEQLSAVLNMIRFEQHRRKSSLVIL